MKKKLLILFCFVFCINTLHAQTNWELLNPKPTASTGKDIDFVTNDIGYIITAGELLETLDAGNTWSKKQNISSGNDMSFHNTTGYVVGNNGYVLKSLDGGTSWNQIATGSNASFNTVNIIDDNTVILSTPNSIMKTDDGGSTWVSSSIPNTAVNKTFFTSASTGHAVCNDGTILKTVNGGQSWYVTQSTNTFPSGFFTVYFIDQSVGFASSEFDNLFKTTDGGETWTLTSYSGESIYDFHFLNQNNGFATGEFGATYKTTDGGSTWSLIPFQNGYIYNTSMYGIYFQDSNIGYATGARGRIIKTTNGGASWTAQSENYDDFNDLKIFDSGAGFARAGNKYYKTTDFGDNWSYLSTVNHFSYCSGFYFVNENVGYSIGGGTNSPSGDVFKTTNGGLTWTQLNIYVDEGLTSAFFIDENVGFISGGYNQQKVMKTTNGGATWTQVFNQAFGQIQFIDSQTGYASKGYSNGKMYKTTDGGTTWNVSFQTEYGVKAFDFVDENNGYFIGESEGIMYRTNNGGATWEQVDVPYGYYTEINFQTKNIGFISDENGVLYKTENGGFDWTYLTSQYSINSIALVNSKIYTAGTSGKIYRSDVSYQTILLHANAATNITNASANLTGNATSNGDPISDIQFEYGPNYYFPSAVVAATPGTVGSNDALNVSLALAGLAPNTTYYYRLKATQNSNTVYSQTLSFTTLRDYEITTNPTYDYSSNTATISGTIVSNGYDITNVAFQYGLGADALGNTLSGTPSSVTGNTTENVTAGLTDLEPGTHYFYRIKATHQGQDIYGEIMSFTTYPAYNINLYSPNINGSNVTLSAYLSSYSENITDVVFEYGTTGFENTVSTAPSQIDANNSSYVGATLTDLDPNLNYHYRLKGTLNGEAIYSEEGIFNLSGNIIMVSGTVTETATNTLALKGLINSYGSFLSNVQFEYGLTDSFGSSVSGTPNYAYGYNTNLITASINNTLPNQTYYYRLVANKDGNLIFSDTYQYTTGTLGLTDPDLEKELTIYPNPATDFLNFKYNGPEKIKSVEFYNALGQSVYYEHVNGADAKVDVSGLTRGIYFIKVNFEGARVVSSKLILK